MREGAYYEFQGEQLRVAQGFSKGESDGGMGLGEAGRLRSAVCHSILHL